MSKQDKKMKKLHQIQKAENQQHFISVMATGGNQVRTMS